LAGKGEHTNLAHSEAGECLDGSSDGLVLGTQPLPEQPSIGRAFELGVVSVGRLNMELAEVELGLDVGA
jgi:hypothetical protein